MKIEHWMRGISIALILLAGTFCGRTADPGSSESHFLESCAETCPSGLTCVCGVCTIACTDDSDCSALTTGARCVTGSAGDAASCDPELDGATATCDLPCQTQSDCSKLGSRFSCVQNRCRIASTSGTGGAAGSSGSASGGSGNAASGGSAGLAECTVTWPGYDVHYTANEPDGPCPPTLPTAGDACTSTLSGIACVYPGDAQGVYVLICDPQSLPSLWYETSALCIQDCTAAGATWTAVTGDCASRTLVACPTGGHTAQEGLNSVVAALYNACNVGSENSLRIAFAGGCATQFSIARTPADSTAMDCIAQRLSTERYDCAATLDCGYAEQSTLP